VPFLSFFFFFFCCVCVCVLPPCCSRDELYQRLPSRVRRGLRTRLKGKHRPLDLEAAVGIRHAMQDMLAWLIPLAASTISWQTEHS